MSPFARSISDDSSVSSQGSSVSFGVVQVREFERIVGDHPCVSDQGPPLSLGWGYYDDGVETPVDSFEMTHGPYPFKQKDFQPLNAEVRRIILQHFFDVSCTEIYEAQKEVERTRKQRSNTLQQRGTYGGKIQDVFQLTTQRLRRRRARIAVPTTSKRSKWESGLAGFLG